MAAPDELMQLHQLLIEKSVQRGDFTLASGQRSSYYVDARLTTMSGRGQVLIGRLGLAAIDEAGWKPAAVGGLTLGADPIAYAIAHAATLAGRKLDAFTVRKQEKSHGTGRLIEGGFVPGMSVVVVEDVITTGESALRAARAVSEAGGTVLGVLAVVDREERGRERIIESGYEIRALTAVSKLLGDGVI
ncbi:MAG: orotate phosphoribosyltransferase [Gemmatimonadota bacterium]